MPTTKLLAEKTRTAPPAQPDFVKHLIITCFFAKNPEKVAVALQFKKQMPELRKASDMMAYRAVLLVEGKYGYFWFTSKEGYLFELCQGHVITAIESLEDKFREFVAVCTNKTLWLHYHVGTKYGAQSQEIADKLEEIRLKLVKEGLKVGILV